MTIDPLLTSGPFILSHFLAAVAALAGGVVQLLSHKGGFRHRLLGYIWTTSIVYLCLSSFFIHSLRMIGPFSPIHLISIFTLLALVRAVQLARRGNIPAHERAMKRLYIYALLLTGAFTLLPGRVMHQVLFG